MNSADEIIVTDMSNYRIQIFGSEGEFIRAFGSHGSNNGQFTSPRGVCVTSAGEIVTDSHRIQVFSERGEFIRAFGSLGKGNGQFSSALGVFVNSAGEIIVSDQTNQRIQILGR